MAGEIKELEEKIEEQDDPDFTEDDYNETPPGDIVAYNELRSCADLFRMHAESILEIKPDFQRDVIWNPADQTRFIDSLIKQLPIPSMCFAFDYKTDQWMVIDGLQRMSTIIRFLKGDDWRLSRLKDINQEIAGKSAAAIKNDKGKLGIYFVRVQNTSLPINVLRCDFSKKSHMEYIFTIFHRLNSGGAKLNNQEIRNSIYGGPLNDLLHELDQVESWRKLNRMKPGENQRFVKQEIILRYFAFLDVQAEYAGQISRFLNEYMFKNRNVNPDVIEGKRRLFERVVSIFVERIFPDGPDARIPTSVLEAALVAVAKSIDFVEDLRADDVRERYENLRTHPEFIDEAVAEGLSKKDKVNARFDAAAMIFSAN